ncbi:hypothetical protein TWF106_008140 [Orbilia oligospora]|uniref:Uncharacterized protein n=1 Tax=Orbilia oligospora TaxID=2813651 RepID=A0A7C8QP75_ORBOL|nr:hypothetical protein TWF679_009183 [Orbilia oligospora]KAF3216739.1 hypothetical protein TWF106_008140 [Orbilia oligospora]
MEVKREEVGLEIGEQRYLTHCAILASLPTEHSKNEKDTQLNTIREADDERPSTKTHRLDQLLDNLASLLVAHGGGDCVAVALGGLTKDKITLLLKAHSQRIFTYLRNFHNAADDPGIQQNVRADFTVQQMIYSIHKIESRYKLFNRELKKIQKLDLGQFEFYDVVQEETVYYVLAPGNDNAEDESLAKDLCQSFFALEGEKENLPEKQKSLIEDLKARPNLPTKHLSRQDFLIWHELFLWLFKLLVKGLNRRPLSWSSPSCQNTPGWILSKGGLSISQDPKAGKLVKFGGIIQNTFRRKRRQDRELSDKEGLDAGLGTVKRMLGKPITWIRNKSQKKESLKNILNAQETSNIAEEIGSGRRKEEPGDDNSRQETQVAVPNQSPDDNFDDPVHQRERNSRGYRSYASLESLTKVVPTPKNSRELSMNDAEEYEGGDEDVDEDENEDGDGDKDDEVGYDDFDPRLITVAEKPRGAARNGLFRRAYALASFQFLIRAVIHDKAIATEVVKKDFTVKVITPVEESYVTSKVENLEETLHRFFALENPNGTPPEIKIQVQDFIKNLDHIIKEGNHRQQLLDHTKKRFYNQGGSARRTVIAPVSSCREKPGGRQKELPSDHIKHVFGIIEELSKRITVKACKAQTKPMSGDSTFSHHGIYSNEYEKGTLSQARPMRSGYAKASKSPQ